MFSRKYVRLDLMPLSAHTRAWTRRRVQQASSYARSIIRAKMLSLEALASFIFFFSLPPVLRSSVSIALDHPGKSYFNSRSAASSSSSLSPPLYASRVHDSSILAPSAPCNDFASRSFSFFRVDKFVFTVRAP